MPRFAQIAIALPIDRLFHYRIPDNLLNEIAVGKRARQAATITGTLG